MSEPAAQGPVSSREELEERLNQLRLRMATLRCAQPRTMDNEHLLQTAAALRGRISELAVEASDADLEILAKALDVLDVIQGTGR